MSAPGDLRPDDPRVREVLQDPDGVIVSWMIVARVAGMNDTGGRIICTDDSCDAVTHMGLAASAHADAKHRITSMGEDD